MSPSGVPWNQSPASTRKTVFPAAHSFARSRRIVAASAANPPTSGGAPSFTHAAFWG
jgi:hypothetical protein